MRICALNDLLMINYLFHYISYYMFYYIIIYYYILLYLNMFYYITPHSYQHMLSLGRVQNCAESTQTLPSIERPAGLPLTPGSAKATNNIM